MITDDEIEVTGRVNLYAVVVDAHWIHFDENIDYETSDSDATYTGPVAVKTTEKRADKKPADPTRRGYQFGGWYEEAECTNAFDWSETGLESDITLYAKWVPDEADYTVIIWKQKITDLKGTPDAQKTYDFEARYLIEDVRPNFSDADLTQEFIDGHYTSMNYEGFRCNPNQTKIVNGVGTNKKKVNSDGSTIVNVYYDRIDMKITFFYRASDLSGESYETVGQDIYVKTDSNGRKPQ